MQIFSGYSGRKNTESSIQSICSLNPILSFLLIKLKLHKIANILDLVSYFLKLPIIGNFLFAKSPARNSLGELLKILLLHFPFPVYFGIRKEGRDEIMVRTRRRRLLKEQGEDEAVIPPCRTDDKIATFRRGSF